MRKWAGAWLLALLIALLAPIDAVAAGTVLTVKTPATIPKAGEKFTVTVEISGNPGFNAAQFTLAFDRDAMDCTAASEGALLNGMLSVTNPNAKSGAIVAAASTSSATKDGVLASFEFKAKKNLDAFAFQLADVVLSDANGTAIAFDLVGAELVVPEPPAPTTPTTPATPSKPEAPSQPETPAQPTQPEAPAQTGGEAAETETAPFADTAKHWGEAWIAKAVTRGLFKGYPDGTFHPDDAVRRCDYVVVLWRMAGEPEPKDAPKFADVPSDAYYAKAAAWANEQGFVSGKDVGFAPNDRLTRQEAMKILFAVSGGQSGMEAMLGGIYDESFADSAEIASWAKPAMYWAYYKGVIGGTSDTTLSPQGTATRAQLAKILTEYQDKFEEGGTL